MFDAVAVGEGSSNIAAAVDSRQGRGGGARRVDGGEGAVVVNEAVRARASHNSSDISPLLLIAAGVVAVAPGRSMVVKAPLSSRNAWVRKLLSL